ncbi:hypothetical protein Hdeb2414_s0222g00838361 [Helianthus debilis subsp. tardiflorus]
MRNICLIIVSCTLSVVVTCKYLWHVTNILFQRIYYMRSLDPYIRSHIIQICLLEHKGLRTIKAYRTNPAF